MYFNNCNCPSTAIALCSTSVLLIDQSYCSPEQWQKVAQAYEQMYQNKLGTVILFDDLSQEQLSPTPTPSEIRQLATYHSPSFKRQSQLQQIYPKAQLLRNFLYYLMIVLIAVFVIVEPVPELDQ